MTAQSSSNKTRARVQFLLVALVFFAPLIAAWVAFYYFPPTRTTNYGELITPTPMPALALTTLAGEPFDSTQLKDKWVMLQIDVGACAQACQLKLYNMRQARLAQGKKMDKVERVFLITDAQPLDAALQKDFAGTRFLRVREPAALQAVFGTSGRDEHIYLIDPIGQAMMRFPANPEAARVVKDLNRLLKVTPE